jgi:hypothetical protein
VSDELGKVSARIRVLSDAPHQTGARRGDGPGDLAFRRASFVITQNSGASNNFLVTPTSITFSGRFTGQCASSRNALVFVFGGSPPYTIANTSGSAFVTSDVVPHRRAGTVSRLDRAALAPAASRSWSAIPRAARAR